MAKKLVDELNGLDWTRAMKNAVLATKIESDLATASDRLRRACAAFEQALMVELVIKLSAEAQARNSCLHSLAWAGPEGARRGQASELRMSVPACGTGRVLF